MFAVNKKERKKGSRNLTSDLRSDHKRKVSDLVADPSYDSTGQAISDVTTERKTSDLTTQCN